MNAFVDLQSSQRNLRNQQRSFSTLINPRTTNQPERRKATVILINDEENAVERLRSIGAETIFS